MSRIPPKYPKEEPYKTPRIGYGDLVRDSEGHAVWAVIPGKVYFRVDLDSSGQSKVTITDFNGRPILDPASLMTGSLDKSTRIIFGKSSGARVELGGSNSEFPLLVRGGNNETNSLSFNREGNAYYSGQGEFSREDGTALDVGILSSTMGIDATTTGTYNLLTIPSDKSAYTLGIVVHCTTAVAVSYPPTLGVGIDAGESDIMTATFLSGLDSTTKFYKFETQGVIRRGMGSEIIKLGVDNAATATAMSLDVDLIGYLE